MKIQRKQRHRAGRMGVATSNQNMGFRFGLIFKDKKRYSEYQIILI